jgi:KaiC/GvpD/RAD55 family RecA-like ATPase
MLENRNLLLTSNVMQNSNDESIEHFRSQWNSIDAAQWVRSSAGFARLRLRSLLYNDDGKADNNALLSPNLIEHLSSRLKLLDPSAIEPSRWEILIARLNLGKTWVKFRQSEEGVQIQLTRETESPLEFCKILWSEFLRPHDVQFFYYRSVCKAYCLAYGPDVANAFYTLGDCVNRIIESSLDNGRGISFDKTLRGSLCKVVNTRYVDAFLECCFSNHYFGLYRHKAEEETLVRARGTTDPEYLLSSLFSVTTAATGLNQLFGGSGPVMTITDSYQNKATMPGRVMMVSGRHGSGKSVLALVLAAEVARKGGVVWYFTTEQAVEEVLFTLRTVTSGLAKDIRVITRVAEAISFAANGRKRDEGALLILGLADVAQQDIWKYLEIHSKLGGDKNDSFSLKLAVIDSINAVCQKPIINVRDVTNKSADQKTNSISTSLRKEVRQGLDKCTVDGMNVLLLEELTDQAPENNYSLVRNIADCVIELSVDCPTAYSSHGYARRHIEILKSRFQRDQRGRHSFSIAAPDGIVVTPSPPAVNARLSKRRRETRRHPEGIGLKALDRILETKALHSGELNVLLGKAGTFKTEIGAAFLTAMRQTEPKLEGSRRVGMFVTMRMGARDFEKALGSVYSYKPNEGLKDCVRVCRIAPGFVTPGEILKRIEAEITQARLCGQIISRIVLDEVGEWPSFSPFIQDDASFGPALLDFFAFYPVVVLATLAPDEAKRNNRLQQFFIDNAARFIDLQRFVHGGKQRALLRVIQSPGMHHKRDAFELRVRSDGKLQLDTRPSLFEPFEHNVHSVAGIQLYLQTESLQQQRYNARIRDQLCSVMSSSVEVEDQDHLSGIGDLSQLGLSVVDKLQLLQIDGFRLNGTQARHKLPQLHELELRSEYDEDVLKGSELFDRYLSRLAGRMREGDKLVAAPYYDNLSFLVGHEGRLGEVGLTFETLSWEDIAEQCDNVSDNVHSAPFFDFPQASNENYNTLFLEILFQQSETPVQSIDDLRALLQSELGEKAIDLFYRLGYSARRYHLRNLEASDDFKRGKINIMSPRELGPSRYFVCSQSTVWRHWFTTYHQMLAYGGLRGQEDFSIQDPDQISLRALPGEWTTAGEWYLCIPEHCAVPAAGNSIIELLINETADLERFELGVGLPVHRHAYPQNIAEFNTVRSTELTLGFFQSLQQASTVDRSKLEGYIVYAPFLGSWLQRLLGIPRKSFGSVLPTMRSMLDYILLRSIGLK